MARRIVPGLLGSLLLCVAACAGESPGTERHAVQGNPSDPNGAAPTDPNGEPGDDMTEQPGSDDDAGSNDGGSVGDGGVTGDAGTTGDAGAGDSGGGGSSACAPAPSGWRPMKAMPSASTAIASTSSVAWNGHEVFAMQSWNDACGPSGCTYHQEAFAYDPVADSWRALPLPPASPARFATYGVALDGKWLLFGGGSGHDYLLDGAIFDPTTSTWTTIPAAPLAPRTGFAIVAATTTHELVFWGGFDEGFGTSSPLRHFADGAAYSLVTGKWRTIAASPLPAGGNPFFTWDGARMNVVYPELEGDGESPQSAAASYDPATDTWQALALPPIRSRVKMSKGTIDRTAGARAASAMWGGYPFIDDGDIASLRDGAWLDPATGAWTTIPDPGTTLLPGVDLDFATSFGARGRLYVWGGDATSADGTSSFLGTGMAYDLASGTWSAMPTEGAPSARREAIGVWTSCDAIVFGGLTMDGITSHDGARFRP